MRQEESRLAESRRQVEAYRPQITLTKAQLLGRGIQQRAQIQELERRRGEAQQVALSQVQAQELAYEEAAAPVREQIGAVQAQMQVQAEWAQAQKYASEQKFPFGASKSLRSKIKELIDRGARAWPTYQTEVAGLEKAGYTRALQDPAGGIHLTGLDRPGFTPVYVKTEDITTPTGHFQPGYQTPEEVQKLAELRAHPPAVSFPPQFPVKTPSRWERIKEVITKPLRGVRGIVRPSAGIMKVETYPPVAWRGTTVGKLGALPPSAYVDVPIGPKAMAQAALSAGAYPVEALGKVVDISEKGYQRLLSERFRVPETIERPEEPWTPPADVGYKERLPAYSWTPEGLEPTVRPAYIDQPTIRKVVSFVPKVAGVAPYLTPLAVPLIASSVSRGVRNIAYPEMSASKVLSESYKEYTKAGGDLSRIEFERVAKPDIEAQIRRAGIIETAVSGTILAGIGAYKGYQFFKKPVTTVVRSRVDIRPGTERIYKTQVGKKFDYRFPVERTTMFKTTTRAREFFGRPALKVFPKTTRYDIFTLTPQKLGKPYLVWAKRYGAKMKTGYFVSGKGIITSREAIAKLPKAFRYKWGRLAEQYALKGEQLVGGRVGAAKVLRVSPKKITYFFGQKPLISQFGTIVRRVKTGGERYVSVTAFKPVTPGAIPRAAGKVPFLPMKTTVYREVPLRITGVGPGPSGYPTPSFTAPTAVSKYPFSWMKTVTTKSLVSVKPSPVAIKGMIPKASVPVVKSVTIPKVVGAVALGLSTKVTTTPITALAVTPAVATKTVTKTVTKPVTVTKAIPSLKTITSLIPATKVITIPVLKPALKPVLEVKVRTTPTTIPRPPTTPPTRPGVPPPAIIPLGDPLSLGKLPRRRRRRRPGSFEVAVRRRGKEVVVSPRPLPRGEALWFGRRVAKTTAAAMFKLIPSARPAKPIGVPRITEAALALEFRAPIKKGKRQKVKDIFIQKRTFRIATPGEFKEITAKGIAKRRKFKW